MCQNRIVPATSGNRTAHFLVPYWSFERIFKSTVRRGELSGAAVGQSEDNCLHLLSHSLSSSPYSLSLSSYTPTPHAHTHTHHVSAACACSCLLFCPTYPGWVAAHKSDWSAAASCLHAAVLTINSCNHQSSPERERWGYWTFQLWVPQANTIQKTSQILPQKYNKSVSGGKANTDANTAVSLLVMLTVMITWWRRQQWCSLGEDANANVILLVTLTLLAWWRCYLWC